MKLRFTQDAAARIDVIDTWWRANRLDAPNRFMDELAKMIDVLESAPKVGPIHRRREPVIRRVLMKRTRHHLYYTVDEAEGVIEVLAVWGTPLEHLPPL